MSRESGPKGLKAVLRSTQRHPISSCYLLTTTYSLTGHLTSEHHHATLKVVKRMSFFFLISGPLLVLSIFQRVQPAAALAPTISPSIFIQNPREGQPLQGVELIEGKIRGEGLISGKLSFSYAEEGAETWFFIADIIPEVEESSQTSFTVEWDTTQITDGNYHLRVIADYEGRATIFELIPNLRIRNNTAVETSTPAPEEILDAELSTPMSTTRTYPIKTPTPLPDNPAVLESMVLYRILFISVMLVFVVFIFGGVYLRIKNRER